MKGNKKLKRKLLFAVSVKKDCEIQTFCTGGNGGQHQNRTETGIRLIHRASGAAAESREERSQYTNKQFAFKKLVTSKKFLNWHRLEVARLLGKPSVEELVEQSMAQSNIKFEVRDCNGKWKEVSPEYFETELSNTDLHTYI